MGVKQVVLLYVSIYHTYVSVDGWNVPKVLCTNCAVTAKGTISSNFWRPCTKKSLWTLPPRFCGKHIDWPARQCPTVITYTLIVDCPWCLPRAAPRWFFYAYCWWLWALLTQFLQNFVSSVTSTDETNNILLFADKTTNKNCPMVGNQQAIDPPHTVNGKGTSAAHAVPQPVTWPTVKADTRRLLLIPMSLAPRSAIGCYQSGTQFTVSPQLQTACWCYGLCQSAILCSTVWLVGSFWSGKLS